MNIPNYIKKLKEDICPICLELPESPIFFNCVEKKYISQNFKNIETFLKVFKYTTAPYSSRRKNKPNIQLAEETKPCSFTMNNPVCYRCAIKYIDQKKKVNLDYFECFGNCCIIPINGYLTYGNIERKIDEVPHPATYNIMDSYNVGQTTCRKCNTNKFKVYTLSKHILSECEYRPLKCDSCNMIIKAKDLDSHKNSCYNICMYCNEVIRASDLDHFCKGIYISNCSVCKKGISINNIDTHLGCAIINNSGNRYGLPMSRRHTSQDTQNINYSRITENLSNNTVTISTTHPQNPSQPRSRVNPNHTDNPFPHESLSMNRTSREDREDREDLPPDTPLQ